MFQKLDRALLGLVKERAPAPTFLYDTFIKNKRLINSRKNALDFVFDNDGIASYKENESTAPNKPKERTKDSVDVKIPAIREEQIISSSDLYERIPGCLIDQDKDRMIVALANEKLEILDDVIMRTHEVAVAQQLASGSVPELLNLKRKTQNAASIKLSGTGTSGLLLLREYFATLRVFPNVAVFGIDAYNTFFKELDEKFVMGLSQTTKLALQATMSNQKYRDVSYEGTYFGVDFYTYRGQYADPKTGSKISYAPRDKVFVGNTGVDNTLYYLPVSVSNAVGSLDVFAEEKYFKRYVDHKSNSLIIEAYSNALPVLNDVNSTGVITIS